MYMYMSKTESLSTQPLAQLVTWWGSVQLWLSSTIHCIMLSIWACTVLYSSYQPSYMRMMPVKMINPVAGHLCCHGNLQFGMHPLIPKNDCRHQVFLHTVVSLADYQPGRAFVVMYHIFCNQKKLSLILFSSCYFLGRLIALLSAAQFVWTLCKAILVSSASSCPFLTVAW